MFRFIPFNTVNGVILCDGLGKKPTTSEIQEMIDMLVDFMNDTDDDAVREFNKTRPDADYYLNSPKAEQQGFVYLMKNKRNGLTKIGFSKDPCYRENTLQSQEPEVELIFSSPGTRRLERTYHEKYNSKRVRGEWFDLSQSDIESFLETEETL